MIHIKNEWEISKMREANRIIALVLKRLGDLVKPGVSTLHLDKVAEEIIRGEGAYPAFKGYRVDGLPPFPGSICASVNACIVHGIPSDSVILQEGDILGVDVGVLKDGFHGDGAYTYRIGDITPDDEKLLTVTEESLYRGIAEALPGNRIGDIAYAIGSHVHANGYHVADQLAGHGIGRQLHEEPTVPNDGMKGRGARLKKGMTIAIEPMVNIGTNRVKEIGWEFFVLDGTRSAHFEHTILITDHEPEILTRIG